MLFDSTDMPFRCGQIVTIASNTIPREWSGIRGVITAIHDEYSPNGIPDDGPIEVQFSQRDCPEWMCGFNKQGFLTMHFIPYELRI
jgi:hypothetical protein